MCEKIGPGTQGSSRMSSAWRPSCPPPCQHGSVVGWTSGMREALCTSPEFPPLSPSEREAPEGQGSTSTTGGLSKIWLGTNRRAQTSGAPRTLGGRRGWCRPSSPWMSAAMISALHPGKRRRPWRRGASAANIGHPSRSSVWRLAHAARHLTPSEPRTTRGRESASPGTGRGLPR